MKKLLFFILITPVIAIATPLDKPVAIAVRSASETDPALKQLWEAVEIADLRISEARSARDTAVKAADTITGRFIRSDAGLVIEGLQSELTATAAKLKQAESDLASSLSRLRSEAVAVAGRKSEIFSQCLNGAMSETQAAEERVKLDSQTEASAETCLSLKASVEGFRASTESIRGAIAGQEKRIADARTQVRADVPKLEENLQLAQKAKADAMAAFSEAAMVKLLAANPESADAIRAYFGK